MLRWLINHFLGMSPFPIMGCLPSLLQKDSTLCPFRNLSSLSSFIWIGYGSASLKCRLLLSLRTIFIDIAALLCKWLSCSFSKSCKIDFLIKYTRNWYLISLYYNWPHLNIFAVKWLSIFSFGAISSLVPSAGLLVNNYVHNDHIIIIVTDICFANWGNITSSLIHSSFSSQCICSSGWALIFLDIYVLQIHGESTSMGDARHLLLIGLNAHVIPHSLCKCRPTHQHVLWSREVHLCTLCILTRLIVQPVCFYQSWAPRLACVSSPGLFSPFVAMAHFIILLCRPYRHYADHVWASFS